MVDVEVAIQINRPLAEVADFAADPDNVRQWYKKIHTVAWQTARPVRLGTQVAFVARFLGRELSYIYEVVEYQPHERMVMRTAEGPFPMETHYSWQHNADGSTRMILRNCGEPRGFSKWLAPLMSWAMRKAMQADLQLLKALLEAR